MAGLDIIAACIALPTELASGPLRHASSQQKEKVKSLLETTTYGYTTVTLVEGHDTRERAQKSEETKEDNKCH